MKWSKKKRQSQIQKLLHRREGEKERVETKDGGTLEGGGEYSGKAQVGCDLGSLHTHPRAEPNILGTTSQRSTVVRTIPFN